MTPAEVQRLKAHRAALLSAPRTTLDVATLPPPVRVYLAQFGEVRSVEARRLLIGGVPYFELLRTHEEEGEDDQAPQTWVAGTIVDGEATEVVDLDFEQGVATFLRSAEEVAQDEKLTELVSGFFTKARLDGAELSPFEAKLPAAVDREPDARTFKLEFEGKPCFAQAYREGGRWEVLVYDAAGRGLGGCYGVGHEPFDLAQPEVTLPLSAPAKASKAARGHDEFHAPRPPKVVL